MLNTFKEWWSTLQPRERLMALGVGILIAFLSWHYLIWQPFTSHVKNLKTEVQAQQQLLAWMTPTVEQLKTLQKNGVEAHPLNGSLLEVLDSSLKKTNLSTHVNEFSQVEQNKVQLKLTDVPFDSVIHWVTTLWQQYRIKVQQIHANGTDTQGVVNVEIILSGATSE